MSHRSVIFGLLLAVGCSNGMPSDPFEAAEGVVERSVSSGARSSNEAGEVDVEVRFNPGVCECPEHEIFVYGRWVRVFLEGSDIEQQLQPLRGSDPLARVTIRGRFTNENRLTPERVAFPVFTLGGP